MTGVLPVWLGSVCADFGGGYVFGAQNVYALFKKRDGGTHRKARSDSDAGMHRQRAMQKFYPRRAMPPRAPPWRKCLETIYHSCRKGKASPEDDARILSEAGLAPSGSPVAQIS